MNKTPKCATEGCECDAAMNEYRDGDVLWEYCDKCYYEDLKEFNSVRLEDDIKPKCATEGCECDAAIKSGSVCEDSDEVKHWEHCDKCYYEDLKEEDDMEDLPDILDDLLNHSVIDWSFKKPPKDVKCHKIYVFYKKGDSSSSSSSSSSDDEAE